jgi:hypothetical protein
MRLAVVLLTALLLAACGRASFATHAPLLAGPGLQPGLRPGLWVRTFSGACPFEETLPASQWPPCAAAVLVRDSQFVDVSYQDDGRQTRSTIPFVLSAAEPHVLQQRYSDRLYDYAVLTPAGADGQGRITAANWSMLDCYQPTAGASTARTEPSPEAGSPEHEGDHGDPKGPRLLPGLVDLDGGCTTHVQSVLFNTARVFAPHGPFEVNFHWVRDSFAGSPAPSIARLRAWSRAAMAEPPTSAPSHPAPSGALRPFSTSQ